MSKVYFEEAHWTNPRGTIASVYESNDYGYVFHATSILIDVLEFSNFTILDCKAKRILDYGCGTGRVTRQFALTGAYVEGYDPIPECINESRLEFEKLGDRYKKPAKITHELDDIGSEFDLIMCVNVIEHLSSVPANFAIGQIENRLSENGQAIIWIHATKNKEFCITHDLEFGDKSGVVVVRGVKNNGHVRYTPVYRK